MKLKILLPLLGILLLASTGSFLFGKNIGAEEERKARAGIYISKESHPRAEQGNRDLPRESARGLCANYLKMEMENRLRFDGVEMSLSVVSADGFGSLNVLGQVDKITCFVEYKTITNRNGAMMTVTQPEIKYFELAHSLLDLKEIDKDEAEYNVDSRKSRG